MKHPTCLAWARRASAVIFASAMLVSLSSNAHHGSAMYDDKQTITVEGAVSKFEWANP
jgi:hypothetical protein